MLQREILVQRDQGLKIFSRSLEKNYETMKDVIL